ncbi:hypothetical protein C0J52_18587 [Blattella germanica]|nr:hypothetical protein C0J52_18587 [Blattella germanica]PSN48011.1 hypothetical protein C0J52_18587 [Blattella germanica]
MADKLAKEAAKDNDQEAIFNRILLTTVTTEINKTTLHKWQQQWETTVNGALCRQFFPTMEQRLKMKIPVTPTFTAILTGHEKTNSYLHRFKIKENPNCPCTTVPQTTEHLIYNCRILESQRKTLKHQIIQKGGSWPTEKKKKNILIENT